MKKPKLAADWKRVWRYYSVHALVIAGSLPAAWSAVPPAWKAALPSWLLGGLAIATAVCGVIGRVVDQQEPPR